MKNMENSIFQTPEWEQFKLATGYDKSFRVENILVLERNLMAGRSMLYSPMVSERQLASIQDTDNRIQQDFLTEITKIGKEKNAIFYRLELNVPQTVICQLLSVNFKRSFEEMQPEHNWVLDITKTEEEMLSGMKEKGRYNVKVAEKRGVTIEKSAEQKEMDIFYEQYSKTGKRHKVSFRGREYFSKLLEILNQKDYVKVFVASAQIEGEKVPLSSAVVIYSDDEALYLYGGSSDENKNFMAPYLLHWEIIKDAKEKGLKKYNFLGIAPDDDEKHPWAGITRFKKQFGGYQYDILGSYDLVFRPIEYKAFKVAEKIRRK